MRLDAAHREFESLDVTNFDDKDVIGDEDFILRDANWVVVKQDPPAGTEGVDTGTTIKLYVGNEDDDEVLEMIPSDSDFAVEVAKDQAEKDAQAQEEAEQEAKEEAEARAEEAQQAAEEQVQKRADAKEYASKIDKALAHNVRGVMRLYVRNADYVQAHHGGPVVAASNALAAQDFFNQTAESLSTLDVAAPDSLDLDEVDNDMLEAMLTMSDACDNLLDAIDTGASSALARELRLRREAVAQWNAAMRSIYGAAGRPPVLVPLSS